MKSIGLHSFRACSNLREIDVDRENAFFSTVNSDLYSKNGKELIRYCFGKNEKEYRVPDGVTDIQESAFDGFNINPYLETIYLPDTLVSIWAYAFRDCSANFVIPASVKNIGSNAFSGNGLTEFRMAEENKSFTVSGGVLYTKDMRELVAVPSYIAADTLTLDRRVEKVRSGALMGNATLRYLVIPADSSLTYLEKGSIVPGSCKSLCGIYIEKAEPFSMAGDAMAGDGSLLYDKCLLYIDRQYFGAYTEAWKNCVLTGSGALSEVLLTSRMVSQDNLSGVLIEKIASFFGLGSLGDPEELKVALALYVDEYSAGFYNFQDTFLLLDGAYRSGYDLTAVMPYLTVFETGAIRYLIGAYGAYTDYQFGTSPSFDLLNRHYGTLPQAIKDNLSDVTEDISALLAKTRLFEERQRANLTEIGAIASDPAHFDRDRAYAAYLEYTRYGWNIAGSKWSDNMNFFRVHCSILIYDFLHTELKPENIATLRGYLEDSFDDNFNMEAGLDIYFKSYFISDTARHTLYAYDLFAERYESYLGMIADINDRMENFDLSDFDLEECRELLSAYGYLDVSQTTDGARAMYSVIYAKYMLALFTSADVTEENYDEFLATFARLSRLIPEDELFAFVQASETEREKYAQNRAALLRVFRETYADLITLVGEIDAENYAEKIGVLIPLYREAYERGGALMDTILLELPIGGETHTVTLTEACASLIKNALIKEVAADFESLSLGNYWDFFDRIYGAGGVAEYEQLESEDGDVKLYYQNFALSDEEVLHYNDLLTQYFNFQF